MTLGAERACHRIVNGSVAYVLMGFPRISELFIASEIHRVEQAGLPLRLYVIKPVEEREQGHDHPVLDAIRRHAGVPARPAGR